MDAKTFSQRSLFFSKILFSSSIKSCSDFPDVAASLEDSLDAVEEAVSVAVPHPLRERENTIQAANVTIQFFFIFETPFFLL